MLSKNGGIFLTVVICIFSFLVLFLLFILLTQHVTLEKSDHTYHEIEFIRYRYR